MYLSFCVFSVSFSVFACCLDWKGRCGCGASSERRIGFDCVKFLLHGRFFYFLLFQGPETPAKHVIPKVERSFSSPSFVCVLLFDFATFLFLGTCKKCFSKGEQKQKPFSKSF